MEWARRDEGGRGRHPGVSAGRWAAGRLIELVLYPPAQPMTRDRPLLWMTVAATVFAFYLPTSINTVISRELSIVSIAGTCVCLLALLGLRGGRRHRRSSP